MNRIGASNGIPGVLSSLTSPPGRTVRSGLAVEAGGGVADVALDEEVAQRVGQVRAGSETISLESGNTPSANSFTSVCAQWSPAACVMKP